MITDGGLRQIWYCFEQQGCLVQFSGSREV